MSLVEAFTIDNQASTVTSSSSNLTMSEYTRLPHSATPNTFSQGIGTSQPIPGRNSSIGKDGNQKQDSFVSVELSSQQTFVPPQFSDPLEAIDQIASFDPVLSAEDLDQLIVRSGTQSQDTQVASSQETIKKRRLDPSNALFDPSIHHSVINCENCCHQHHSETENQFQDDTLDTETSQPETSTTNRQTVDFDIKYFMHLPRSVQVSCSLDSLRKELEDPDLNALNTLADKCAEDASVYNGAFPKASFQSKSVEKRSFTADFQDNKASEEQLSMFIDKLDFAQMQILGQFNLGFIIVRLDNDLFIIDQHAAYILIQET